MTIFSKGLCVKNKPKYILTFTFFLSQRNDLLNMKKIVLKLIIRKVCHEGVRLKLKKRKFEIFLKTMVVLFDLHF